MRSFSSTSSSGSSRAPARGLALCAALFLSTPGASAAPPTFIKGPYLQGLGPTSVVIRWESSQPADGVITLTEKAAVAKRIERLSRSETTFHSQWIDGLEAGTTYRYTVASAGLTSAEGTFTTPKNEDERFTFQVYGDNRSDHAAHAAVVAQMRKRKADFGIHTGDMVLSGGKAEEWNKFFEIEGPLLRDRCVYACIGNHELIDGGMPSFLRYFHPGMHGEPSLTYTVRWGSARFFFLNAFAQNLTTTDRAWLEKELGDADAEAGVRHRFIVMHQGPSSSGPHGGGQFFDDGLRKMLLSHKITMVFAGHDHLYERGVRDGLRYIVTGGGGAPLYPSKPEKSPPTQAVESSHHFVSVDVDGAKITTTAIRKDGSTMDRCFIEHDAFTCEKTAIEVAKDPITGANVAAKPKRRGCDCAVPGTPGNAPEGLASSLALVGLVGIARRARHRLASRRRRLLPSASMSKRPSPAPRFCLPRLSATAAVLSLALFGTAATGCATYTQDLDRGIKHYDASEHEKALAVFRSLENDTDSFDGKERARYYYYRGMTDYRLATAEYEVRPDARYWLGLAHAANEKTPGSLSEEQKKRLADAMTDLNDDVYGTGTKAKGAAATPPEKLPADAGKKKSATDEKLPPGGNKAAVADLPPPMPPMRSASSFSPSPPRSRAWPRLAPLAVASLLAATSVGCASTPAQPPKTAASGEPAKTDTGTTVLTAHDGGTPVELFDRAKKLFVEEKFKEAAELFDLLHKGDPQGRLSPMALYQAGLCYEALGDRDTALARYELLATSYPKDSLQKLARLRQVRVLWALERWTDIVKQADGILARADLTVTETIEAKGAKGLALVETGDVEGAARLIEDSRTLMEKHHLGESGKVSHEIAQVFFGLGEVRRKRSETIVFDPLPPNFGEAFERRAQGLLDAQSAYTDTMRTTDVAWATMAGYRVGELYQALHRDVMAAKFPAVAKTAKDKQLFEGAMRLRYRILLEKGLKMMTSTVGMTDRLGESSTWSARAKEAKANIEKALAAENAAIAKLPISEADLKKLLDDLQARRDVDKAKPTTPLRPARAHAVVPPSASPHCISARRQPALSSKLTRRGKGRFFVQAAAR